MRETYGSKLDNPIDRPPRRVVSLVPSVTESLFDLMLGDRLIAITDYCVYPVESVSQLPKIGGTKNPDVQRIIAMRPDLVIANQEENRKADIEILREAKIPVWVTFPHSVADAFNLLWNIMHVFDEPVMVPRVRLIEQTMDWVWRISEKRVEDAACRVFVPIWLDPLVTFNGDTYASDILRVCGAVNVFADRERQYPLTNDLGTSSSDIKQDKSLDGRDVRYPRVTIDEVVAAQPDMILLPSEPYHFIAEHILFFKNLDVPASRNNKILLVDGSLLTWHGTRVAYALNSLPDILFGAGDT